MTFGGHNGRPAILTFLPHYLPGYRYGGPVRTVANMVEHLGERFSFHIVTLDRDALQNQPYPDVNHNVWTEVGKAQVLYCPPRQLSLRGITGIINGTPHDILYLNSFFHPVFTIRPLLARRLRRISPRSIVVAPRGEFSPGAYALKWWKKRPYTIAARVARLYAGVTWQASTEMERDDIQRAMGKATKSICIARDLPPAPRGEHCTLPSQSSVDRTLRVLFLSLIVPKKNLDYALRVLQQVRCPVAFHIYGPIWDDGYWRRCTALMAKLPAHIQVHYHGEVHPQHVGDIMAAHDLFFLPTRGENYGHVVPEALVAGTPVLVSDQTPWRGLEHHGTGWDLPLQDPGAFVERIEALGGTSRRDRDLHRERIRDAASAMLDIDFHIAANETLFRSALHNVTDLESELPG